MRKFYQHSLTILLVISLLTFSGCASIVGKSSYRLPITSNPNGANITITDMKGRTVHTGVTPTSARLRSGAGFFKKASYTVTFELDGYDTRTVPVHFDLNAWYFGNVVFGGFVGFLVIDPLTGAMWKLDTKYVNETLQPKVANATEPTLELLNYNTLPDSMKPYLVEIR
ncbi:hypothetical protein HUW51_01855 [Adhaeribacter swui]|uniref:PEGA domain-containing protein n=1 Tax=Adhaeribacter swui TaxID=2086471 RepID=A0A7G7G2Z5_9BACT|nr:hypothetical protein [Adhaeribacter swui]QNF31529.1 hypothetical protein HUW51_01855 [Adhaeribacter swui]